jgi:nitroreductase
MIDAATVEELLTTTRAVRRRLDLERPVDGRIVRDCLRLALQAPTAEGLTFGRWLVITDPPTRRQLAEVYARGIPAIRARAATFEGPAKPVYAAAEWLAKNLHRVPVLVVPCLVVRPPAEFSAVTCGTLYGSILPAVWSFQLALRSRGLGSVFTTLHLNFEAEARAVLGIPADALQIALVPIAHARDGAFHTASRPAVAEVAFADRWGQPCKEVP